MKITDDVIEAVIIEAGLLPSWRSKKRFLRKIITAYQRLIGGK